MLKEKRDYLIPIIGFSIIMLIGGLILYLPMCHIGTLSFTDALFTSVSATTTTGFSLSDVSNKFTSLGHFIIAILMNIGAIGFISLIVVFLKIHNKRLYLSDFDVVNSSIGNNSYVNLKEEVLKIIKYVLAIEFVGSFFLCIKFIPEYGFIKGIGYSIFHSISAFSNTGFDLFGSDGFSKYNNSSYVRLVIIFLMIAGGIGFLPINDIASNKSKRFNKLKLQTKIVLVYSAILIIISTIGIKAFEGNNITWINALFMGTTTRSTGLFTVYISSMSVASRLFILLLMIIGGAPGSTAGGIKVVVFAVIEAVIFTTLTGKKNVVLFWRKIDEDTIKNSITILMVFIIIIIFATILMLCFNNFGLFDIFFVCVSAISTTGLTSASLQVLNFIGKIILMILMVIGRIGPLSILMVFFPKKSREDKIEYPNEELIL